MSLTIRFSRGSKIPTRPSCCEATNKRWQVPLKPCDFGPRNLRKLFIRVLREQTIFGLEEYSREPQCYCPKKSTYNFITTSSCLSFNFNICFINARICGTTSKGFPPNFGKSLPQLGGFLREVSYNILSIQSGIQHMQIPRDHLLSI